MIFRWQKAWAAEDAKRSSLRHAGGKHKLAVVSVSLIFMQAHSVLARDFYEGKQINIIVSSDAGNSYDTFARLIGRYLPKYVPGAPAIVVENMPGAGGLRATNWLYNAAPKDGLTIGLINNTLAFDPLYGDKLAQFVAEKFNWLGSPSQETGVFIVWSTVPVNTIKDARSRQLILSATGTGSTPAFFARVFASVFDMKVKIIPGYKSQPEAFLAMQRGENDGNASPFWSSLTAENADWIRDKKIKVLFYYGAARDAEIPGPYVFDLVSDPEQRSLVEIAQAGLEMGRPMLAPPGVASDKIAILRKAVGEVFTDPAYQAECARLRLNCRKPSSGDELLGLVKRVYALPKPAIDKNSAIYREGEKN